MQIPQLELNPYKEGIGASSRAIFTLKMLQSLAGQEGSEVRQLIQELGFLETWCTSDVKNDEEGFGDRVRVQTMFLHSDQVLRAITNGGVRRSEGTWIIGRELYVKAQTAGIEELMRYTHSDKIYRQLEELKQKLSDPLQNTPILFGEYLVAMGGFLPFQVAIYQTAIINVVGEKKRKIEWGESKVPGVNKLVILSPGMPHYREVQKNMPFPTSDGIHVVNLPT